MAVEKVSNIFQRINKVHKTVKTVTKDDTVTFGNDTYQSVSHDAVTAALHLPIAEAGIAVIPNIENCTLSSFEKTKEWQGKVTTTIWYRADLTVSLEFVNIDDPQDRFKTSCPAFAFDTSDKAIGKAYSMAIKTMYLKTFMLESLDKEEERKIENYGYDQRPKVQSVQQQRAAAPAPRNVAPSAKEIEAQKQAAFPPSR